MVASHDISIILRLLVLNLSPALGQLPQTDGSNPEQGMYCRVLKDRIQFCYPCDMWLRSTCWEEHLLGKFQKKNTDKKKKKKHKLKHHKIGKKHTKNKDNNKKKHKLEDHR